MFEQLMSMMTGNNASFGTVLKMLTPMLTDKNIQKAVPGFRNFILEEQAKVSGKLVISAELSDDGAQLNMVIWRRDPDTKILTEHRRVDLFSLTQQQIKDFCNGLAAAAK